MRRPKHERGGLYGIAANLRGVAALLEVAAERRDVKGYDGMDKAQTRLMEAVVKLNQYCATLAALKWNGRE